MTMDRESCRSITRTVCLRYACDKIHRAQELFERFRFCDCSALGGMDCQCVSKLQQRGNSQGARSCNFIDRNAQTGGKIDSFTLGYFSCLDQADATSNTSVDTPSSAPAHPTMDVNRKILRTLARQRHLSVVEAYDGIKNPYVLVINNVNFYFTRDPRPRNGASHDRDNVRTFVKEAGFKTVVERFDLPKKKMLEVLEETRLKGSLVDHDSFICIIMSHGNEEGILASDSQTVPVDDITAKFQGGTCPQLATKPKLFFLQACRGDVDDDGYVVHRGPCHVYPDAGDDIEEMPVKFPSDADFLIAYSTTRGYVSHRRFTDNKRVAAAHGKMLGSWFISCLVQVFQKYSHKEDLMTMLTRVNNSMCREYTVPGGCKQISCQLSMLTKKVYFANYFEQGLAAAAATI